jgi:cell wall-associated NlpC family hydrolase
MISPAQVVRNARTWIGVPFLHQGRARSGADCLGFISASMMELDSDTFLANLPRTYGRNPQALLEDGLRAHSRQIALQPAALVLIKFLHSDHASHAAIYTGSTIIHAYQNFRRVVEHGYQEPWLRLTVGIWALPDVNYV